MFKSLRRQESGKERCKINYGSYEFSLQNWVIYIIQGLALLSIFSYFFYRSKIAIFFLSPLLPFFLKRKKRELCERRKNELSLQFKECLLLVNSSVQAGYSLENAFMEAHRDLAVLYGVDGLMVKELSFMKQGIRNSRTIEELLYDLGKRSSMEDIRNFSEVLAVGKKSGGNINAVLAASVTIMEEKVNVMQEIETMVSARKMEQKIMNTIPFFIIIYVEFTSKGFFDVLYHNPAGICVMTCCLICYLLSVFISLKIVSISV